MELEVGDVVLCTVERIAGTIVFVKIDETGQQGSIILSEIAPGRIRNLRDYVVPKKKIICKVLRIAPSGNIDLSLRRVTKKEQKEIREQHKHEKSCKSILKSALGDKADNVIEDICGHGKIYDFLQEAKEAPKELEKLVGKTDAKKIIDILKLQKQKKVFAKRIVHLTTTKPDGLKIIKSMLEKLKEVEVKYISAGRYSLRIESEKDIKVADNKLREIVAEIEKTAKKQGAEFSAK